MKKNFKRLLCLVLVVSLVCSLSVMASAIELADYTDVDDITYVEAVDVLTGVGILEGNETGTFNPNATMTRAEAAKIISYLKLGADTASALAATSAPFDDVPLTHWAAGYIAYCASAGIVNGDGTGNFNPDDEVTAYQFGKMLLCVLGYGVNDEYTGASWAVTVAADAGSLGLFKGKVGSLSGNTAITRDEMALYAFNTLVNAAQVKYNETFGEYYVGTSALSAIDSTIKSSYQYSDTGAYKFTIGYQSYSLQKSDEGDDVFGRGIYCWEQDEVSISDNYVNDDADYTYTGKVENGGLYSDLGKSYFNGSYTITYIVDGVDCSANFTTPTSKNDDWAFAGRGSTTEIYLTEGTSPEVKIVVINTYLGQISDIDDDDDIVVSVDVYTSANRTTPLDIDSDTASNLAGYEEDQYVLVTMADDDADGNYELQTIAAATSVSGSATAYGGSNTTIAGTKYNHSEKYYMSEDRTPGDYDVVYNVYLDGQGNMIGIETDDSDTTTSANYLLVTDSACNEYSAINGAAYAKAAVTFTDGTEDVIYLKVTDSTKSSAYFTISGTTGYDVASNGTTTARTDGKYNLANADDAALIAEGIYSYTVNSNGYYTLKALNNTTAFSAKGVTVTDDSSTVLFLDDSGNTVATKYARSSTQLILVDDAKTYTGYTNFPNKTFNGDSATTGQWVLYVLTSSGSTSLKTIYVFDDATVSVDLTYALFKGDYNITDDGTEYTFIVNGQAVTYLVESDNPYASLSKFKAAGFIDVDSDGYATFYTTGLNNLTAATDATGSTITGAYYYDSDNYMYVGTVVDSGSDYVYVNFTGAGTDTDNDGTVDELDVEGIFGVSSDAETTRISTSGGNSSANCKEGDTVYVFLDEAAYVNTSGVSTGDAVAVIAVDPAKA